MSDLSPRLGLPMLAAGQAQKEITHNEALLLVDALTHLHVVSRLLSAPPLTPQPGQCWIVGPSASGAWVGHDNAVAIWSAGGWRFVPPQPGMTAWSSDEAIPLVWETNAWLSGIWRVAELHIGGQRVVGPRQPSIADPVGGAATDTQARAAISLILEALRNHGLIGV